MQHDDIRYWGNYGDGKIYYQVVLDGRRRKSCQHEPVLLSLLEHMMEVTKKKMVAAGMNPDDYYLPPQQA